jgi:hypothetical protein
MGMSTESARGDIKAFCSGLDSLVNSDVLTPNVGPASGEYDDCGLRRQSSVATGSITPYSYVTSQALTNIASGSELFKNYGKDDCFGCSSDEEFRPSYHFDQIPAPMRSTDWLNANGACLVNIRVGVSEIQ